MFAFGSKLFEPRPAPGTTNNTWVHLRGSSMRSAAALCFSLLAVTLPSRAQPYVGPDGFSICPFANSDLGALRSTIGPCQPLTERAILDFDLSASQKAIVTVMQSFAAKPDPEFLQQMANAKSLAAPKQFAAAGKY